MAFVPPDSPSGANLGSHLVRVLRNEERRQMSPSTFREWKRGGSHPRSTGGSRGLRNVSFFFPKQIPPRCHGIAEMPLFILGDSHREQVQQVHAVVAQKLMVNAAARQRGGGGKAHKVCRSRQKLQIGLEKRAVRDDTESRR